MNTTITSLRARILVSAALLMANDGKAKARISASSVKRILELSAQERESVISAVCARANEMAEERKHPFRFEHRVLCVFIEPSSSIEESVMRVFSYWQEKTGHERCKPSETRLRIIRARLKDGFSEDELRRSVDGIVSSDFHMGRNDSGRKYCDVRHCMKDAPTVESFRDMTSSSSNDAWEQAIKQAKARASYDN